MQDLCLGATNQYRNRRSTRELLFCGFPPAPGDAVMFVSMPAARLIAEWFATMARRDG
jgi:hypothetical protein